MFEIIFIIIIYFGIYYNLKNTSLVMLNEVKTNFRLYPKHYSMPPRWMRKHFNLKKADIPKYLIVRLSISLCSLILMPIAVILCLATSFNEVVLLILVIGPILFYLFFDLPIWIIAFQIFKRR